MRLNLAISGRVQGVGFRPYLWRLANGLGLCGYCRNSGSGVEVEVQGKAQAVREFERRLTLEAPPLAKIERVQGTTRPELADSGGFAILASHADAQTDILISPDIAVCPACLAEIRNPADRRFGYPFANCTDCGPRFSIIGDLPYDRATTTMTCFNMCGSCRSEYHDPQDRRFHAQPVACPACGPAVWFVTAAGRLAGRTAPDRQNRSQALLRAAQALVAGEIVALRGLGGFQLACDAMRPDVVATLRQRKRRPHKALALMVADLASAEKLCAIGPVEAKLLCGEQKPIVLCRARADVAARAWLAPDTAELGLMLPYTPLHALLFDLLAGLGRPDAALVMTSANPAGEPICLGNREALRRLAGIADAWLLHDRDILGRVDDSVVAIGPQGPYPIRRSRGYVPEPVRIGGGPCAFGAGADLKTTFCLTRGEYAYPGQHIGDLDQLPVLDFYAAAFARLVNLLKIRPQLVACDLHPDFESVRFAVEYAGAHSLPLVRVQHHLAHAVACLAENGHAAAALAICLDGSGVGTDGTIWGGEILLVDPSAAAWQRLASLAEFPLPGGEAAIREPWRIAAAFKADAGAELSPRERIIADLVAAGLNCPRTSSAGRLFDAVAAALGLCDTITYEGQAAIRLMQAAMKGLPHVRMNGAAAISRRAGRLVLDSAALFQAACARLHGAMPVAGIAAMFHCELAQGLAAMAAQLASESGVRAVALTGGAMQNGLLAKLLVENLRRCGLEPLLHRQIPPGDGGISVGQAVWARCLARRGLL